MVVVILGECCEMPTGSRAPPRLELTLFTHHASRHNLTQRNATQRASTPHGTMQHHPPRLSSIHAAQRGATHLSQHLHSQISPKPLFPKLLTPSIAHPEGLAALCSPWLGRVLMVLSLGSVEHPGHPRSWSVV